MSVTARVVCWLALTSCASGASRLEKVQVSEYRPRQEVAFDIGELVASGLVEPVSAIAINEEREKCWVLRTPEGPPDKRWPRNLLNARPGAPDLAVSTKLEGGYDIYVKVRAVHMGGAGRFPRQARRCLPHGL